MSGFVLASWRKSLTGKTSPDLIILGGKLDLYERDILHGLSGKLCTETCKIQMENGRQYGKMESVKSGVFTTMGEIKI